MGYWNTRGLRGSTLEELINYTNDYYLDNNLALIQKIPTPIKPITIEKDTKMISKAYFEKKSTVDYIGVVQGVPVCFDAKETNLKNFPLKNIHTHQIEFMNSFTKQDGVAFLIIYFTLYDRCYFLPFDELYKYYLDSLNGARKSIPYEDFKYEWIVYNKSGAYIHYLENIKRYLEM